MEETTRSGDLRVRRSWSVSPLWLLVAAGLIAVAAWFVTHPEPLPVSDETINASTPVGVPVYVGVFAPTVEAGRTLHVRAVKVSPAGDLALRVAALLCQGGSVAITSEPETFCTTIEDAAGATLGPGDVLVLEISGDLPGSTTLDRVEVSYRDGLQWATQQVGPRVLITILAR